MQSLKLCVERLRSLLRLSKFLQSPKWRVERLRSLLRLSKFLQSPKWRVERLRSYPNVLNVDSVFFSITFCTASISVEIASRLRSYPNVLNVDSVFFSITFCTASISVEIASCSVSSCFNLNSRFLSSACIISIFALISCIA